jgi:DNA-directed RNA polymerase omega subunit
MAGRTEIPESKFAYVAIVSRRARQLMEGARPLLDNPKAHKPSRLAEEELLKGLLEYELPVKIGEGEDKEKRRK